MVYFFQRFIVPHLDANRCKLLTTGTKQETTIIKLGDFELSLSTMVGGFLILGGVFTIYKLLDGFY